jgi:hypothetical protein
MCILVITNIHLTLETIRGQRKNKLNVCSILVNRKNFFYMGSSD